MARSIWKGSIAFGLVSIPVDLYSAEDPDELSFTQLDKHDFSPIGYKRINKSSGKEVAWESIVKGYDNGGGEYVVLSPGELEAAAPEKTKTLDLVNFVDVAEIEPWYFEKPYYLVPTKAGKKAYALLRETLARTKKAGIAKVVVRTRQHIAALVPAGNAITMVILRYANEVKDASKLDLPSESMKQLGVTERELQMAEQLVKGMVEEWKPKTYHDEYREDVMDLIHKKVKAGEVNKITEVHTPKAPRPSGKVIDLMDLLKQSVEGKTRNKPTKGPKVASTHRTPHPRKSA